MESRKKYIGELLLEYKLINEDDLNEGLRAQKNSGSRLGEALVRLGRVSSEDVEWIIGKQLDIPFFIIDEKAIDPSITSRFQREFLLQNRILPVCETEEELSVVTDDPFNEEAIASMKAAAGKRLKVSVGNRGEIERALTALLGKAAETLPASDIYALVNRFSGTGFYRLDFMMGVGGCRVGAYGLGITKDAGFLDAAMRDADVLGAFEAAGVPVLYEKMHDGGRTLLTVYPLQGAPPDDYPAVLGSFGLCLPTGMFFTDMRTSGSIGMSAPGGPVPGYIFMWGRNGRQYPRSVYTPDSCPSEIGDAYVRLKMPATCDACGGIGCAACNEMGHKFTDVEGRYTSRQIGEIMREVRHGRD